MAERGGTGLAGRIALVTGASRGMGLAIAESLEAEGAHVVRLARSLTPGRTARRTDIPGDVTREADIERIRAQLVAEGRVPDILANNAGSFLLKPLVDTTPAEFRGAARREPRRPVPGVAGVRSRDAQTRNGTYRDHRECG